MEADIDIITIGEGLVELSSDESLICAENFNKYYGGDTLSAGVTALRSGSTVAYIAKVANDCFGEYLLDAWQLEGLDTSQVKLASGQNGIYFVGRGSNKVEMIFYRKKTAATMLGIEDINFDFIKRSKMVYATGFVQSLSISCNEAVREVFSFAKENGIKVAYSPNFSNKVWSPEEAREAFYEISDYVDILLLNLKDDATAIFEQDSPDKVFGITSDLAIETTVIRENLMPTYTCTNGDILEIPFEQEAALIDSTGSDAVFNGAFLSYHLKGMNNLIAARYANIVAGIQMQNIGAIRSIPDKQTVEDIYRSLYG